MISSTAQAVLLLTAHISKANGGPAPLTSREWGRFAEWLRTKSLTPEKLLAGKIADILDGWHDRGITADRLETLLGRGPALAIMVEKWQRAGLWVMTRADHDYPRRLKQRLAADSPPVLFGCGNRDLLNSGGLAVVGSRNAGEAELAYSRGLGEAAAAKRISTISGGARGVDEAAMLGALEAGGEVIGVLPDNLLRASSSAKYRRHLMTGQLVLVSPFNPEAGFNAGHAMQRNKYIYCLADAAMVVQSGKSGGTWAGAHENLGNGWVPLWVRKTADPSSGNGLLTKEGAIWAADRSEEIDVAALFSEVGGPVSPRADLFEADREEKKEERSEASAGRTAEGRPGPVTMPRTADAEGKVLREVSFYELFLAKVGMLPTELPFSADELVTTMQVNKTQVNAWLGQAVADGRLKKRSKPVRYEIIVSRQVALPIE